ncbi:MAG: hypothetical protein OEV72_06300 [Thermoleophilia bacterium]|nr:hypothetical protein [Thermoleophilia bacterium]
MVARVARFDGVNMAEVERTTGEAEATIRPMVEGLPGFLGHLELGSPGGEMLSITFFDTEDNAESAEPTFDEELPRQLGELFASWEGRRVAAGRYTVLAHHWV